jgi:predicted TIM-barrel fold metal-dependent hydrolase
MATDCEGGEHFCSIRQMQPTSGQYQAPVNACDCHVHVFDAPRYPYTEHRAYTPGHASISALKKMLDGLGFSRVVLVQPSVYGTNNDCLLDAIAQLGVANARGIAVVDLETVTCDALQVLHAKGVRGIRLNLHMNNLTRDVIRRQVNSARLLTEVQGFHLQVHASLSLHSEMLDAYADLGIPIVLDHFAGAGTQDEASKFQLERLLKYMETQHIYVKLSAAYRLHSSVHATELTQRFYHANPDRVLWGTDWPHTGGAGGIGRNPDAIEPFRAINNSSALHTVLKAIGQESGKEKLLIENPERLFEFGC